MCRQLSLEAIVACVCHDCRPTPPPAKRQKGGKYIILLSTVYKCLAIGSPQRLKFINTRS